MNKKEYLEKLSEIFDALCNIQKNFTSKRGGIKAVLNFITEMSRKKTSAFSLEDPLLIKGSDLMNDVVEKLDDQYKNLKKMTAPEDMADFHKKLENSIKLQITGYKEMTEIFSDYKVTHVLKGKEKVSKALEMMEAIEE